MKISDPIHISDLDFRVQSINNSKYATILVYKDARVDMNRLNEVYGAGNWQRKHEVINGNLFCSVGLYHKESMTWSWVQDCGTESQAEKEKGQASDSFKRACFNLGIGIELYDYPLISIKLKDHEVQETGNQKPKYRATFEFKLKEWVWDVELDGHKVTSLVGKDEKGNLRFKFPNDPKQIPKPSESTIIKDLESAKTIEELGSKYKGLTPAQQNLFKELVTRLKLNLTK